MSFTFCGYVFYTLLGRKYGLLSSNVGYKDRGVLVLLLSQHLRSGCKKCICQKAVRTELQAKSADCFDRGSTNQVVGPGAEDVSKVCSCLQLLNKAVDS